ncbi:MAG: prepilin-type N-terminal cleavage/methylation domain-containing protein [Planctomycetota bacterium]|nr:MAG: prepilin-type N-terminal cleavage/methylation domain-containing protein [Planctomycetota bacterium]
MGQHRRDRHERLPPSPVFHLGRARESDQRPFDAARARRERRVRRDGGRHDRLGVQAVHRRDPPERAGHRRDHRPAVLGAVSTVRRAGFSLLELLIALLAIALVAALAIPAWFSRHEVSLESAVQLLARDVRGTQNQAAWLDHPLAITFQPDGSGWRVVRFDPVVPAPLDQGEMVSERVLSADAVFEGVRIDKVELGPERALRFDRFGQSLDFGSVTLEYAGERRTLLIDKGSGRLRIAGSTSEWTDPGL